MNLLMNPLATYPIPTGWKINIKPYTSGLFHIIDNQHCQISKALVGTPTQTRSNGPEPMATLRMTTPTHVVTLIRICKSIWLRNHNLQQCGQSEEANR